MDHRLWRVCRHGLHGSRLYSLKALETIQQGTRGEQGEKVRVSVVPYLRHVRFTFEYQCAGPRGKGGETGAEVRPSSEADC